MGLNKQNINQLASRYPAIQGRRHYQKEQEMLQSLPQKFEDDCWGINVLLDIMDWMRPALKRDFQENKPEDVQQALEQVRDTTDIEEKVEILDSLYGVGVSVASAILLFIDPDEFAVMTRPSVSILRDEGYSLLSPDEDFTPSDYVEYVELCRTIADSEGVTLRELDRALVVASND